MRIRKGFVSNSSSSSFVCDISLSPEEVIEQLHTMLYHFGQIMDRDYEYSDVFGEVFSSSEEVPRREIDCVEYYWFTRGDLKDKVIIRSQGDNAIPYEMFDLIESRFNAFRIHRG